MRGLDGARQGAIDGPGGSRWGSTQRADEGQIRRHEWPDGADEEQDNNQTGDPGMGRM